MTGAGLEPLPVDHVRHQYDAFTHLGHDADDDVKSSLKAVILDLANVPLTSEDADICLKKEESFVGDGVGTLLHLCLSGI